MQDSHSYSIRKGIIRGLHYQKNPMAQARLVRVVSGEIFDVVVDIRKGSPYYGKWISTILSFENKKMLYIPEGFAHGFCTLSEQVNIIYKFTKVYSRQHYTGIVWNDPVIGIDWPIKSPVLSERDCAYPVLDKADNNFIYACV